MKTNNKGFSLVELIVVIAIMAILAAVAIPTFASFITKANIASDVSFVNDLEYAAELAHTADGDKVTEVKVKVNAGAIEEVTYKVGTVTVTIKKTNDAWAASAVNAPASEGATGTANAEMTKAANDTVKAIDWTYTFKNYKTGTYWIDPADAKALTDGTTNN